MWCIPESDGCSWCFTLAEFSVHNRLYFLYLRSHLEPWAASEMVEFYSRWIEIPVSRTSAGGNVIYFLCSHLCDDDKQYLAAWLGIFLNHVDKENRVQCSFRHSDTLFLYTQIFPQKQWPFSTQLFFSFSFFLNPEHQHSINLSLTD